jgi:DNA-binding MarR family transcriptional regulator
VSDDQQRAERFAERFRAVYLTFHRRDGPRSQLQGASRAVLEHLAMAGPLTIGEAAAHLNRAQSVISAIVSHLEEQGLLERESDPADRRRTLIWLTPAGHSALRQDREVLGLDLLARAFARVPPRQADELVAGLQALVQAAGPLLRPLHRRIGAAPVLRPAIRADGGLAGAPRPGRRPRRTRAPDAPVHGHHARLAGSPARRPGDDRGRPLRATTEGGAPTAVRR